MRKANENDFDKITAYIYKDNTYQGNGCLLWSADEKHLYCITAKHCTMSKEGVYNIIIKYHNDGKLVKLKIKGQKMIDEYNDIAIFEIEQTNDTDNIPMTQSYDTNRSPSGSCYRIAGYAENSQEIILVWNAKYMTNDRNHIHLNLSDLDCDSTERFEEIKGMSGCGCYRVVDNTVYFVGIQSGAIDYDVRANNVLFVPFKFVNDILRNYRMPLLEEPRPDYVVNRIGNYYMIDEVLKNKEFSNKFAEIKITGTVEKILMDFFEHQAEDRVALYFCGLSGIGKTRGVLEACKHSEYSNILYYKNYADFSNDIKTWQKYMQNSEETVKVIIDEASVDNWNDINNEFYGFGKKFKPILIGTVPKNQCDNGEYCVLVSGKKEDVGSVLRATYTLFSDEEIEAIYKLSYDDLRLAILIARLYNEDRKNDREGYESILNAPSIRLRDSFGSADKILKRIFQLFDNERPLRIENINDYFYMLSLFVDIGCWKDQTEEVEKLANFFGDNVSNFIGAVDYFININLGLRKGYAFELSPRALAKLAFEQHGWNLIKHKVDEFMEAIPTVIMRKKFFDRVKECSIGNEVLASWFQRKYGSRSMALLNYDNAYEIGEYIEYFPETGLTWLKDVICNASNDALKKFGKDYYSSRRQIVFACEHLANFEEYFFICEEILFRLALNETEMGISNNSQGVWSSFFSIIATNTEVPFCNRYDVLIRRMQEVYNENDAEMFKSAILGALSDKGIKLVPPRMIGGTITPKSWYPGNLDELIGAKKYILESLLEHFNMFNNNLQDMLIEILSEHMDSFASFCLFDEYKNAMNTIIKTQRQKNKLIHEIEEQCLFKRDYCESNETELQQWIDELKDLSLKGRLDEFLSRTVWSYGYSDEGQKEFENAVIALGDEVNKSPEKLKLIKDILEEGNYDNDTMRQFAESLATEDQTYDFMELIKSIKNPSLYVMFCTGYYSGVYKKYNTITDDMISFLDAVKSADPNFSLWGSIAFDISDSGFKRILSLIGNASEMQVLINMKYDPWAQFLDDELKIKLLNTLVGCCSARRFYICFELCAGWISKNNTTSALYEAYTNLIDTCVTNQEHFDLYPIVAALDEMPEEYQMRVIVSLLKMFSFNSVDTNNDYIIQAVFKVKNEENEKDILAMLGAKLISTKDEFRGEALTGLFDGFSLEAVKEWIEKDAEERAPLIAYHLPSPNLTNKNMSELTKYILITYEDNDEVYKNFVLGGYNLKVYSVDNYYENREKWYELLSEYENSKYRLIRKWAAYKKANVKSNCEEYERLKAMDSRYE